MALDLRASELEHNFIKERINSVEKHFVEISSKISAYLKKLAHLRDSGDDLAKCILQFASKEILNQTLRIAMGEFSDILSSVQEYRDAQIQRTEVKVVLELANYSSICKHAKAELKKCFEARSREMSKKNHLEKTRGKNPTNWQKIAQAEKEVNQAQDEATRTTCELAKQIDKFEKQKLEDMRRVFLEFIKIQLLFHTKAIELYTNAYNVIKNIRIDEDLREFRSHFKAHASALDTESIAKTNVIQTRFHEANADIQYATTSKSPLTKGIQGPQRSVLTQKTRHSKMDNSTSSFDSFADSKFEFGDHNS